jgi:hypothetical protein
MAALRSAYLRRPSELGVLILGALSFFLIEGPNLGWLSVPEMFAAVITVLTAMALMQQERRGAHPLLPRALFVPPSFTAINIIGFLFNSGMFGLIFLLSLYLQQGNARLHCSSVCHHMSYSTVKSRTAARSGWRKITSIPSMSAQTSRLTH